MTQRTLNNAIENYYHTDGLTCVSMNFIRIFSDKIFQLLSAAGLNKSQAEAIAYKKSSGEASLRGPNNVATSSLEFSAARRPVVSVVLCLNLGSSYETPVTFDLLLELNFPCSNTHGMYVVRCPAIEFESPKYEVKQGMENGLAEELAETTYQALLEHMIARSDYLNYVGNHS